MLEMRENSRYCTAVVLLGCQEIKYTEWCCRQKWWQFTSSWSISASDSFFGKLCIPAHQARHLQNLGSEWAVIVWYASRYLKLNSSAINRASVIRLELPQSTLVPYDFIREPGRKWSARTLLRANDSHVLVSWN